MSALAIPSDYAQELVGTSNRDRASGSYMFLIICLEFVDLINLCQYFVDVLADLVLV